MACSVDPLGEKIVDKNHNIWYSARMKVRILRIFIPMLLMAALAATGCASHPKPNGRDYRRGIERTMEITAYDSCQKCTNWKRNWLGHTVIASGPSAGQRKDVGITASGAKAEKGTIAADTSHYPFGTVMYVPGYGYGRVEDRGKAMKGKSKIDIYYDTHKEALQWGRRNVPVKVWLPK
jgi:3D (Asp-Asp-Asp) domain-containing protein